MLLSLTHEIFSCVIKNTNQNVLYISMSSTEMIFVFTPDQLFAARWNLNGFEFESECFDCKVASDVPGRLTVFGARLYLGYRYVRLSFRSRRRIIEPLYIRASSAR